MNKILFFVVLFFGLSFSITSFYSPSIVEEEELEIPITTKAVFTETLWDDNRKEFLVNFDYLVKDKKNTKFLAVLTDGEKYYVSLSTGEWIVIKEQEAKEYSRSLVTYVTNKTKDNLQRVKYEYISFQKISFVWRGINNKIILRLK